MTSSNTKVKNMIEVLVHLQFQTILQRSLYDGDSV